MTRSDVRTRRVHDTEVHSDHCGGLTTPVCSPGHRHFVKAGVALSGAGSAVAMQRQYQAGKRVVDRVQTAHCVYPARYRRWSVVDLVHDIHVESFASFLVVLMTRHE
jgi:hypothetical protein